MVSGETGTQFYRVLHIEMDMIWSPGRRSQLGTRKPHGAAARPPFLKQT